MSAPAPAPTGEGFQYVPVPDEHVGTVYALLARLASGDIPSEVPTAGDPNDRFEAAGWTRANLLRLMSRATVTTSFVSDAMDYLAGEAIKAGDVKWRNNAALAEALHLDPATAKNRWSKLWAHLRANYDGVTEWPVLNRSGDRVDPSWAPALVYGLSVNDATTWLNLKNEQGR